MTHTHIVRLGSATLLERALQIAGPHARRLNSFSGHLMLCTLSEAQREELRELGARIFPNSELHLSEAPAERYPGTPTLEELASDPTFSPEHDLSIDGMPRAHEAIANWQRRRPATPGLHAQAEHRREVHRSRQLLSDLRQAGLLVGTDEDAARALTTIRFSEAGLEQEREALRQWEAHAPRIIPESEWGAEMWGLLENGQLLSDGDQLMVYRSERQACLACPSQNAQAVRLAEYRRTERP